MSQLMKLLCFLTLSMTSNSGADIIVLSSGERLEVSIIETTLDSVHVTHPILGELHIATEDIKSIETTTPLQAAEPTASKVETELPQSSEKPSWNQTIKLGGGYQSGQTDNIDINTSYHADRTVNEHEVRFDVSYRLAETDKSKTANRFSSAWGNKWFHTESKWDYFTNLQFEWAEFQSWEQRLVGDIGIEFKIYQCKDKEEVAELSGRLGGGFRKEFQSENDDLIPEGLLGLAYDWKLTGNQSFKADTTWFPDIQDFANYRLVSHASWNIKMTEAKNLDFSLGLQHEYDSVVDTGVKKTYLHFTAGISYSF